MRRTLRSLPALVAMLGLIGLGGSGCAKKIAVDQIGAQLIGYPEGRRDSLDHTPSDLVVWPDVPNLVQDNFSPSGSYFAYRTGAGAVMGQIFDYLEAGGYQVFRRESGGGYRLFYDFVMSPYRRWADPTYYGAAGGATRVMPPAQFFTFTDAAPPATPFAGYVGRAVISGYTSADFPLTNLGQTISGGAIPILHYTGNVSPPDSLIPFQWDPVPGAKGYWIHVYQTRSDIQTGDEAVAIGLAAPVAIGKVRDLFVGFIPAPATSYTLGDPIPAGGRVLVYRKLVSLVSVLVRVSAVDADGNMIAAISTNGDTGAFRETVGPEDRVRTFPLGALIITPRRPPPPTIATGLSTRAPEVFDSGVPGLTYLRTSATALHAAR